jgi:hypothetical protein
MAAAAKAASVSEFVDLVSVSSDEEPNTPPQSSSKRSRVEISDEKASSSKKASIGAQTPAKLLWRLTNVDGIDSRFNEGAVTFKDLVSGDWNSAVFANCKWIMFSGIMFTCTNSVVIVQVILVVLFVIAIACFASATAHT